MKNLPVILIVVIFILFGYITYLQEFKGCPECSNEVIIERDTILKDTTIYVYKTIISEPEIIIELDTFWEYHNVDTTKILSDYFKTRIYRDTLKNDTSAFIKIEETITQNKITKRDLFFKNRRITAINTKVTNPPRVDVYVGSILSGSKTSFNFSGSLLLKTKKDNIYGLYWSPITHEVGGQIYWKIKLNNLFKKRLDIRE
jgi:hypothetical protein